MSNPLDLGAVTASDLSFEDLGLGKRATKALLSVGVVDVAALVKLTDLELSYVDGVGDSTRQEISLALSKKGLALRAEDPLARLSEKSACLRKALDIVFDEGFPKDLPITADELERLVALSRQKLNELGELLTVAVVDRLVDQREIFFADGRPTKAWIATIGVAAPGSVYKHSRVFWEKTPCLTHKRVPEHLCRGHQIEVAAEGMTKNGRRYYDVIEVLGSSIRLKPTTLHKIRPKPNEMEIIALQSDGWEHK